MRQAADILASPAAMQIRQLEALQAMAKTASSKVVFVPMSLQTDVAGQLRGQTNSMIAQEAGEGSSSAQAGLLTSMADM
jgi:erythrocyte band 7 integral membrane protein